jgi:hypothetical protein
MKRKLKLALLSMHEIATHGKKFESDLMGSLPEGTSVIAKSNDMEKGSLKIVLHNEEWEEVPNGEDLETVIVTLGEQEETVKLVYNH